MFNLDPKRNDYYPYTTKLTKDIFEKYYVTDKVDTINFSFILINCSTQSSDDNINCGYYVVMLIYNFLYLLPITNDENIENILIETICPEKLRKDNSRTFFQVFSSFVSRYINSDTEPRILDNFVYNTRINNYLSPEQKSKIKEIKF